jgi:hypothetical protein
MTFGSALVRMSLLYHSFERAGDAVQLLVGVAHENGK